jgi:hypothetical protein
MLSVCIVNSTKEKQSDVTIADPDRSNPTRPRLERPLETIRSFEAAIEGNYNKRYSQLTGS